jgi:5-methyltetrahydrofolate--homocysteine methyltransferase
MEALKGRDLSFVEEAALDLASEGYDAVRVNVDAAGGDSGLLAEVVNRAQGYVKHPLILETGDPVALEKALRIYRGVAGVVIGKVPEKQKEALVAASVKYGSIVLTL